jgi:hypothetical protein
LAPGFFLLKYVANIHYHTFTDGCGQERLNYMLYDGSAAGICQIQVHDARYRYPIGFE